MTGVNHESIRKYRREEWKRLEAETRRKMTRYLEDQPARESPSYAEGMRDALEKIEGALFELRARLPLEAREYLERANRTREARAELPDAQTGSEGGDAS